MAWRSLTIDQVRLTPQEKAAMSNIQGAEVTGADILLTTIREFVSAIRSGGNAFTDDDSVPDLVRAHVINRTRWLWLCEFPAMKVFQTEGRSKLNDAAEKARDSIADGKPPVEAPATPTNQPAPGNAIQLATQPDPGRGANRAKLNGLI